MHVAALIAGLFCLLGVALDAFQTIILPRRPTGRFSDHAPFFVATWARWVAMVVSARATRRRRTALCSIYGPLSLLLLLLLWALLLITGFALIYFSMRVSVWRHDDKRRSWRSSALTCMSAERRCLLDFMMWCLNLFARGFIVFESGVGLGFVALVIGYLPVLYQAFSRREVNVALLDSRLVHRQMRLNYSGGMRLRRGALTELLAEWERWAAEILESHVSYPILCYTPVTA